MRPTRPKQYCLQLHLYVVVIIITFIIIIIIITIIIIIIIIIVVVTVIIYTHSMDKELTYCSTCEALVQSKKVNAGQRDRKRSHLDST